MPCLGIFQRNVPSFLLKGAPANNESNIIIFYFVYKECSYYIHIIMKPSDLSNSSIISKPDKNDVLFGRGGAINSHEGNITFRMIVNEQKEDYFLASKIDKPKIAIKVVDIINNLSPPGRFLAPVNGYQKNHKIKGGIMWYDVGSKKARAKASQCLRERERYEQNRLKEITKRKEKQAIHNVGPRRISSPTSSYFSYEGKSDLDVPDDFLNQVGTRIDFLDRLVGEHSNITSPSHVREDSNYRHIKLESQRNSQQLQNLQHYPIIDPQVIGQSSKCDENRAAVSGHAPDNNSLSDSWLGSFYSLESYLIDTSRSFSSTEGSVELNPYGHSSSSTMSDITYQSEY